MASIILFNKPYGILSQFSGEDPTTTLSEFIDAPGFYPAGRLDKDSEGLLLLTDCGQLQHQISHPNYDKQKTYWAQVEGTVDENALQQLRRGVVLKDGTTKPAEACCIQAPQVAPRIPPIRERKHIPTSWIALKISEGKNRQVRRMTAAVGFPTLRLIRVAVGDWQLEGLAPGDWIKHTLSDEEIKSLKLSSEPRIPHRYRGSAPKPRHRKSPASSRKARGSSKSPS